MSEYRTNDGLPVPYDHRKGRNFVEPVSDRRSFNLPAQTGHNVSLDIMPSATQEVIVHTSALDRAKGHAWSTSILGAVLGALAVLGVWALAGEPFLTFWLLLLFWGIFAVVWAGSWALSLIMSSEGVSLYEARRKWNVVEREQIERWNHYKWESGRLLDSVDPALRRDLRFAVLMGLAVGVPVAVAILLVAWGVL